MVFPVTFAVVLQHILDLGVTKPVTVHQKTGVLYIYERVDHLYIKETTVHWAVV